MTRFLSLSFSKFQQRSFVRKKASLHNNDLTDLEKLAFELVQMTLLALFVADGEATLGAFVRGVRLQLAEALQAPDRALGVGPHDGRFLGQDQL